MSICTCSPKENNEINPYAPTLSKMFKALGHPIRVRIVGNLMEGERCVCALHEGTGRELSTISSHLNILRAAGIIVSEQRGKNVFYRLNCPCMGQVYQCLCEHIKTTH